jgi:Peptidase_C39 like family
VTWAEAAREPASDPHGEPTRPLFRNAEAAPGSIQIDKEVLYKLRLTAERTGNFAGYNQALEQFLVRHGGRGGPSGRVGVAAAAASTTYLVAVPHVPQEATNWCAPAAAVMVMKSNRIYRQTLAPPTQEEMRKKMDTGPAGGGGTGIWTVDDALNFFMNGQFYTTLENNSANGGYPALFRRLKINVDAKYPSILNAWERSGTLSPHYNGHPQREIKHYIVHYAYSEAGYGQLYFMDPAANTTVLGSSWSNVQPQFLHEGTSFYSNYLSDASRGLVY